MNGLNISFRIQAELSTAGHGVIRGKNDRVNSGKAKAVSLR